MPRQIDRAEQFAAAKKLLLEGAATADIIKAVKAATNIKIHTATVTRWRIDVGVPAKSQANRVVRTTRGTPFDPIEQKLVDRFNKFKPLFGAWVQGKSNSEVRV